MNVKRLLAIMLVAAAFILAIGTSGTVSRPVLASGPCDAVLYDPDPPGGQPEPLYISGTVIDDTTSYAIQGATMKLFKCSGSSATQVASTSTNSQGVYGFFGLATPYWYYVEADMSGVLSGMTPASGTNNPTAPIGIGNSVSGVNFRFQ